MDYIVLDMEWNQPWPGSPSSKKVLPVQIRGEIIQIGAVRVTEDEEVADEFGGHGAVPFLVRRGHCVSDLGL